MRRFFLILIVFLFLPLFFVNASSEASKLKGKILLQVESRGEAYYVHPVTADAYYMANGDEAYNIMRNLGIGITNNDLEKIKNNKSLAKKQAGKIFLQVESKGEAYYVNFDGKLYYLKNGSEAYNIMRNLGLGITNKDLKKISIFNEKNTQKEENISNDDLKNIENAIVVSKDDLLYLKQLESKNNLLIEKVNKEREEFSNYYNYKLNINKVLDRLKSQKSLIELMISICNSKSAELESLKKSGEKINSSVIYYDNQLKEKHIKYISSEKEIDSLYEEANKILDNEVKEELKEKNDLLTNQTACVDEIKGMSQEIINIKSEYFSEVEEIKKQPIPTNFIYGRIEVLTNETNFKIDILNNKIADKRLECLQYFNQ